MIHPGVCSPFLTQPRLHHSGVPGEMAPSRQQTLLRSPTPLSVALPSRTVGTTSSSVTLTPTNNTALAISIAASGQYKTTPSGTFPCGVSLSAHANSALSATFSSTVAGTICGRPPDPTRARILNVPTELPEEEASKTRSAG